MQEPDVYHPWDAPEGPSGVSQPRKRAALVLWILGGLQLVAAGCCCTAPLFVMTQPISTLEKMAEDSDIPLQMLLDVRQHAWLWIGMIIGLVMLPAVAYLILGFGVRAGKKLAANVGILVALTQAIVVGVALLANVATAIVQRNPANLTFQVLTLGSALALLIYCIRLLMVVRRGQDDDASTDPWDEPGQ